MRLENNLEELDMSCNEWQEYTLKDVIEFNPKESIKKGTLSKKVAMDKLDTFKRKISGYEETEFTSGTKFRNGDTLLARITPCLENGKTARVDILEDNEVGFGSTEFIVMREKAGKTINDFIYYLSISPEFRNVAIKSMTGSSGRQRVQKDVLENVDILLPSIEEQEKIANILSSLDDKIELNNEMNKTLEEMAQALFKRWFVDFEFPNEEGMPYKSSGGEMVESELGMIPKEWEVGYFSDISEIHDSKRIPLSKMEREKRENIYPYYGAASLMDYVDDYIFDGVYILMGEDGTVIDSEGYPILQYVYGKFWVNNHAHVLRGKNNFSNEYLYLLLKNTKVSHIVTGAVQPKINQKNLNSIRCVIPSDDILEKFNSMIKSKYEYRIKNEDENKVLREIRDTVLTKLMSGEIRVK